jgi:hypothetical protein
MMSQFSLVQPGMRSEQVKSLSSSRQQNPDNPSQKRQSPMQDAKTFRENPRLFSQRVLEVSVDSAGDVRALSRFAQDRDRQGSPKRSTLVVDDAFNSSDQIAGGLTHGMVVSQLASALSSGVNVKDQTNPAMRPENSVNMMTVPGLKDLQANLVEIIRRQGPHLQKTIEGAGGGNVVVNQSLGASPTTVHAGLSGALGNPFLTWTGYNRRLWQEVSPGTQSRLWASTQMMFSGLLGRDDRLAANIAKASDAIVNAPEVTAAREQLYRDYQDLAARYPKAVVVQAAGNSSSLPKNRPDQNLLAPTNYEQLSNFVMVAAGDNNRTAYKYPGFAFFNSLPSKGPTVLADGMLTMPVQRADKSGAMLWVPGTSISAPIVSAMLANAQSLRPDLTARDLTGLMKQTANDLPGTPPEVQGSGWVEPARFFEAVRQTSP